MYYCTRSAERKKSAIVLMLSLVAAFSDLRDESKSLESEFGVGINGVGATAKNVRASTQKETLRASMRTHHVSGLRAPKAFKNGALRAHVHLALLLNAFRCGSQFLHKLIVRASPPSSVTMEA